MNKTPSLQKEQLIRYIGWGSSLFAIVMIAILIHQNQVKFLGSRDSYELFPYLGLLAFGLMWSHYITAAFRAYLDIPKQATAKYFEVTSLVVLLAILLHPGLLAWQLWRDGFGLPPKSYLDVYVAKSLAWAAVLGMISFLIFIAYELRRKFENKSWWQYVQAASDLAMLLIFIHAIKLGSHLQDGWFVKVWYFYGVTLAVAIAYIYVGKFKREKLK